MREVTATGIEALMMASQLLQRARRADPTAGLWEAADVQWSWRTPRRSDEVAKPFWADGRGPVAGVLLTALSSGAWQCDPVAVPGASHPPNRAYCGARASNTPTSMHQAVSTCR